MEFLKTVMETLFKMILIGAAAFGGIRLGAYLRKKKEAKKDEE